jgi:hypothetical protein
VTAAANSSGNYGSRPGEKDEVYTWGRSPSVYLTLRQVVRLTIYRSKLRERCATEPTHSRSRELDGGRGRASGLCGYCGSSEVHRFTADAPVGRGRVLLCRCCDRVSVVPPSRASVAQDAE